jgi:hypothetical protein
MFRPLWLYISPVSDLSAPIVVSFASATVCPPLFLYLLYLIYLPYTAVFDLSSPAAVSPVSDLSAPTSVSSVSDRPAPPAVLCTQVWILS